MNSYRLNNCVKYTKFSFFSLICQKLHMFFLCMLYLTANNNEFLMCFFSILWQIRKLATHYVIRAFNIKNILYFTGIQKGIINLANVVFLRKHIKHKGKFIISKTIVNNKCEACLCSIPEPYCLCMVFHSHKFSQLFFFFLLP